MLRLRVERSCELKHGGGNIDSRLLLLSGVVRQMTKESLMKRLQKQVAKWGIFAAKPNDGCLWLHVTGPEELQKRIVTEHGPVSKPFAPRL